MEFKKGFSLALLLVGLVHAQRVDVFLLGLFPTIAVLFGVGIAIISITYMLGKVTNNTELLFFAKSEIWQLILTALMFITYSSFLAGTEAMFSGFLGGQMIKDYSLSWLLNLEDTLKSSILLTSQKEVEFIRRGAVVVPALFPVLDPVSLLPQLLTTASCLITGANYPLCALLYVTNAVSAVTSTQAVLLLRTKYEFTIYANILSSITSTYARLAETLLIPLRIIVSFLFTEVFPVAPLIAVALRLFPWTREAGNMVFTLTIAFGIVFPFFMGFFFLAFSSSSPVDYICSKVGSSFQWGPFSSCELTPYSIPNLFSIYPLIVIVPYLSFAIALTFATNFNKLFDYFKR